MKRLTPLLTGIAAAALIAGCGGSSYSSSSKSTPGASTPAPVNAYGTPAKAPATPAGATAVVSTKHDKLGTVLAGRKGLTLYLFEADKGTASACSGACAQAWPPLTTQGTPTVANGAVAADLGTIKRSDGTTQVTYKGHPLYYFVQDKDSGDAYGQGSKAFGADWYVVAPSGKKIDAS